MSNKQVRRMTSKWSIVSQWEPLGVFDIEIDEDQTEDGGACICPPDLVARGGYRGGCAAH